MQSHPGSSLVLVKWIQSGSKLVCKNHHAWFGGMQPACLLPVSHFQTRMRSSADGLGHTVQSQPGSSLVLATCIWSGSKLVCKNHQARFWQNATSPLPVFHLQTQLRSSTDGLGHIVQSQPGSNLVPPGSNLVPAESNLVPADCVKFWPNGSGLEVGWCARITSKY